MPLIISPAQHLHQNPFVQVGCETWVAACGLSRPTSRALASLPNTTKKEPVAGTPRRESRRPTSDDVAVPLLDVGLPFQRRGSRRVTSSTPGTTGSFDEASSMDLMSSVTGLAPPRCIE